MFVYQKIIIVTCTPEFYIHVIHCQYYVMLCLERKNQCVNVCLPEDNHSYMHSRILYTCLRLSILCYVMVRMGESMG